MDEDTLRQAVWSVMEDRVMSNGERTDEVIRLVRESMALKDAKRFFQQHSGNAHPCCWQVRKEYLR